MYYNRILRVWVIDPLDIFLISAIIGSILVLHLKNYLSEKASMERLRRSIINKSNYPPSKTNIPISLYVAGNLTLLLTSFKQFVNFQMKFLI